jgi:hypothetical protein
MVTVKVYRLNIKYFEKFMDMQREETSLRMTSL